jgi:hypothetical protein
MRWRGCARSRSSGLPAASPSSASASISCSSCSEPAEPAELSPWTFCTFRRELLSLWRTRSVDRMFLNLTMPSGFHHRHEVDVAGAYGNEGHAGHPSVWPERGFIVFSPKTSSTCHSSKRRGAIRSMSLGSRVADDFLAATARRSVLLLTVRRRRRRKSACKWASGGYNARRTHG